MAETDKILFPCKDSFQFPIGYILMSASKINPATFLNYGKWVLLGSGRTILGAGDTDNGKETGGSFSKILTSANIPGHTHSLPSHTHIKFQLIITQQVLTKYHIITILL